MSIFVSIASYRDDVCSSTLESLYSQARFPENIFVGICQQNNEEIDPDCFNLANVPELYKKNVRIIRIPYTDAQGPNFARYLCSTLVKNEDYYFQVDSHSAFVKDWDIKCIKMITDIKSLGLSNKPVISHYPKEITDSDSYLQYSVPRICKSFFNERGMLSFLGAEEIDTNGEYYNTPYVAGGMMFCESSFLKELPYDPDLPYIFVGEEILLSVRFYTNGWDVFTPSENIVFHEYTRADKPKIWTDQTYSDQEAFDKILVYLELHSDKNKKLIYTNNNPIYGLGKERSLQDFYDFIKADTKNKQIGSNFCKPGNIATDEDIKNSSMFTIEGFSGVSIEFSLLVLVLVVLVFVMYKLI